MCGRFIQLTKTNSIKKKLDIKSSFSENLISYNIAPSQYSLIITNNKFLDVEKAKWGFTFIEKKTNLSKNVINSRIESIKEKYLFKESYFSRKCIIPANGYYEWYNNQNKKIPFFIHIPESEPIYFAGIWKYINFKENKNKIFSIITKNSNSNLNSLHHRMPIILSQNEGEIFINNQKSSFLDNTFNSSLEDQIEYYSVSKLVNNPINNSIECIKFQKTIN